MSAHLNEAAHAHTHDAPAEVFPQGFAFPSQSEALVARAAHLEVVPTAEAVVVERLQEELPDLAIPTFSRQALFLKRTLDVVIALACLICALPLFLVVGLLVALTSRGPILFKHKRVGKNGEPFLILKFRTMHHGAEQRLRSNPVLWDEYVRNDYKLPASHCQVTKIGNVLRKLSLDEIPQFWNVLVGHMSITGIRPLVKEELEGRPHRSQQLYALLRPGVTGLWQVEGRSLTRHGSRIALDDNYVLEWNNRRDLGILLRTPVAVLKPSRSL
ncbi:MAG: sugar transferase [Actinobacteria bacterium]|uniref:Unannotated protein n=1 Tax=freshwater metagenome TaxID=449393 RepID=A0A6J6WWD3_9ZZZZ|nr:sugar transferase [Actinomycetota bacterium]